jgi:hypothetical protein
MSEVTENIWLKAAGHGRGMYTMYPVIDSLLFLSLNSGHCLGFRCSSTSVLSRVYTMQVGSR